MGSVRKVIDAARQEQRNSWAGSFGFADGKRAFSVFGMSVAVNCDKIFGRHGRFRQRNEGRFGEPVLCVCSVSRG